MEIKIALRAGAVREEDQNKFLNQELVPVVRELRRSANRRHGRLVTVEDAYSVQPEDGVVVVDSTLGDIQIILPFVEQWVRDLVIVKLVAANNVILIPRGTATIAGAPMHVMVGAFETARLISIGTDWVL